MNHQYYNVLGVMSGTSLDGLDIAHVSLVRKESWSFQIHNAISVPYPEGILEKLKKAIYYNSAELESFDQQYTIFLAEQLNTFIDQHNLSQLVAICSHGHTIHHRPHEGYTCQIGNNALLAQLTHHRVICDFRPADVALGGQGAPLVPIGDQLLFSQYDYCLNLGGFANLSFQQGGDRVAYDICPVNVVLNHYSLKLGKAYDEGGAFAKAGTIQTEVLEQLNNLEFYKMDAPKSLGIEWVQEIIFPLLDKIEDIKDILATFTEHIAQQISHSLHKNCSVISTGGGTFNQFLIARINSLKTIKLFQPSREIIDFKESIIFALLGVLRLRNENNCLSSATGAIKDHCSGEVYTP